MPQAVECDRWHSRFDQQRAERLFEHIGDLDRMTHRVAKDPALLIPERSHGEPCFALAHPVTLHDSSARSVRWTFLRLFGVFGWATLKPSRGMREIDRRTCTVLCAKSTSSHLSPRSSPSLMPVVSARTYRASSKSSFAAARNCCACSPLSALISCFGTRGASTASQTLRQRDSAQGIAERAVKNAMNMLHRLRRVALFQLLCRVSVVAAESPCAV